MICCKTAHSFDNSYYSLFIEIIYCLILDVFITQCAYKNLYIDGWQEYILDTVYL